MTKKLMALLLAVLMAVSLLPMPALADGATTITTLDPEQIAQGGSYVLDKNVTDITLTAPLTISKDVTIELTGQTITLKLDESATNTDAAVFHVAEKGSLTLKGSGTVKVPDSASGVFVAKDAAVTISGEVSISGGANGVKATSGESRVKISVNTLGTIESNVGINLSGATGTIEIAAGTIKGKPAISCENKLGEIAKSKVVYIGNSAADETQLGEKPTGEMLVFDNGEAPALTLSSAKRTSETEAAVTFTASKAGTYYYQLDSDTDLFSVKAVDLVRGTNTISLTGLDEKEHTVYIAAKDAFGKATESAVTATVPAVLAAPDNARWDDQTAAWDAVEGATTYTVKLFRDGTEVALANNTTTETSFTFSFETSGVYTFQVQAVSGDVTSAWSDMSGERAVDKTAPEISSASASRADASNGSVTFTSNEAGTVYYIVGGEMPSQDDLANAEGKKEIGSGETKIDLSGLGTEATKVYLMVEDAAKNRSGIKDVTVPLFVPAPGNARWDDQTAAWDAVVGATSYTVKLFRDGTEVALANNTTTETSFTFSFETSGVYTFQVQAVSGDVTSAWSDMSGERAVDKTAPEISSASASRADASNGSVTFTSNEAGTVYYIVGGEMPSQDDLANAEGKKEIGSGETKIDLSGLGTEATKVYLMVEDAAKNRSGIKDVTVPVYLPKPTMADWYNGTTNARWNAVEGATGYNVQLFKDGNAFGNATFVNGVANTSVDLASAMTEDGVYTFQVQATATGTQSEWSDASATSYTRDVQKPTVKAADPSRRIDAKTAEFSFIASEDGTYYYMVGLVNGGVPTAEQVADDKNPHAGCTNAKTTIKLTDIADTNARKVYVAVRDKAGNLSEKPFEITIPAYSATVTPTPTPAPATPTPTAAPTTYTVTLQGGTGYTIAATGGSKSPVNAGGSFSFTVTPSSGYTRGNGFAVKANGTTLTSNNGVYTISNINANQTVSVSGIVKSQNGGGTLPAAPAITTTTLAAATMGKEYRQQITATGGTPITWSYSGTLPDGMTLAANTGILSGTPTQEGSFRFAVKATNSTGFSTRQMTLVVAGSEYSVTKGANSEWTQGGDKGIDFSGSGKGTFTVKVDGAAVAAGKYTASSDGSTVTLKPEYLDTLAAGSHTVTLVYNDGSAKAKFTIKAKDKTVAPTVSSQPTDADVAPDGSATFTVTASGTTPLLCQWQVDKNDGSGWTDISGAVNASYTVEKVTAEQNGWKYRCVIKNAAGSVESNAATLTIKEAIGDVKKNDDQKDANSGGLGRILLITGIVVAVLALAAGLYFYFRRRNTTRYMD